VVTRALALAADAVHPAVLHHSLRTARLAALAAAAEGARDLDAEALAAACVLHDVGAGDRFDGPQRFEVEGADAAAGLLTACGWQASRVDAVWEAIALHTSPGIAERRGPIARYLRLGVLADFGRTDLVPGGSATLRELEGTYPRLAVDDVLPAILVAQARRNRAKAPSSSWVGTLLRDHPEA
jgi:hypothetical protein